MAGKRVQIAGGSRQQEKAITGLIRELRVDVDEKTIRVHDGLKQGGYPLATQEFVERTLLQGGSEQQVGVLQFYSSIPELQQAQPALNILAVIRAEGAEDSFVWSATSNDAGDIASDINGYWKRLDSQAGLALMLWRAKMISMQINGSAPAADQDDTVWLTNGVIKLYDGTNYEDATPALWMRLFASVGGYSTASFELPNRLQEIEVLSANFDNIAVSGWFRGDATTVGNPVAADSSIFHDQISATKATQIVKVHSDASKGDYIRYRTNNSPVTWTAFTYRPGVLPNRLLASQAATGVIDDLAESGFYVAADGSYVTTIRVDANTIGQIIIAPDGTLKWRRKVAGTWSTALIASDTTHNHDGRYYTETEMDSLLADKAALVHNHDDRYYTESEMTSLLAGKISSNVAGNAIGSFMLAVGIPSGVAWNGTFTGSLASYWFNVSGLQSTAYSGTYRFMGALYTDGGSGTQIGLVQRIA